MIFKGHGGVWNPEKNEHLCKFINGEYKTDDEYMIKMLTKLGYESDYKAPKKAVAKKTVSKKIKEGE